MEIKEIEFKGSASFKKHWATCITSSPITVIIGRNNTGKSAVLSLVKACCEGLDRYKDWEFRCAGFLDEKSLRVVFPENVGSGILGGNFWHNHGQAFIGTRVEWEVGRGGGVHSCRYDQNVMQQYRPGTEARSEMERRLQLAVAAATAPYKGKNFWHLWADRDIRREAAGVEMQLAADGGGATNIVKRLITSANPELDRNLISNELRGALNDIFGPDGSFNEIFVKQYDDNTGEWEVYLGEEKKGLIALSQSGSGLKTILLVLIYLIVLPAVKKIDPSDCVFAFEELENNLHPALLRRLYLYIERYAINHQSTFFLTTHSSVALDLFGGSGIASIVLVENDGESARTSKVNAHLEKIGVLGELGARPSDLLQSNGIVWVEGPSDAIFINKWIDLISNGALREGRDYICAFYGGSLLARLQVADPAVAIADMVNLILINPNFAMLCDSDKSSDDSALKDRVQSITEQVERVDGAYIWVTQGKEIENYLSGALIARAYGLADPLPDPGEFEYFFPSKKNAHSYWVDSLKKSSVDKMELATRCASVMNLDDLKERLDLLPKIKDLVEKIRRWNE